MNNMLWDEMSNALFGIQVERGNMVGAESLRSAHHVTPLIASSVQVAGVALARLCGIETASVVVDAGLAARWAGQSVRPLGWALPPAWDPLARVYEARDGWVRLHTNVPAHKAAALAVLGTVADPAAVQQAVAQRGADELEAAVVEAGGCAASMRSAEAWLAHPQGKAVAGEALVQWSSDRGEGCAQAWQARSFGGAQPLAGLRVLDLTRVLAGPVASRFLAGFGATVLRIDPPDWNEPGLLAEVTLGKFCAGLDLRAPQDREVFERLLREADVLLHGYRPGALEALGFTHAWRRSVQPGLVDVTLSAYGWSGPWCRRRGFDSLVQMSTGIAQSEMRMAGATVPGALPVQALDHATGYLMAAAVLEGVRAAKEEGEIRSARLSLARTAALLQQAGLCAPVDPADTPREGDFLEATESTEWGPAHRLKPPLTVGNLRPHWRRPAGSLRRDAACWPPAFVTAG